MKLRLTSIAIATYLAAAAGGVASAQTVVKIGHVAPLTGSIAHLGKDNEMGGRLAIEGRLSELGLLRTLDDEAEAQPASAASETATAEERRASLA